MLIENIVLGSQNSVAYVVFFPCYVGVKSAVRT